MSTRLYRDTHIHGLLRLIRDSQQLAAGGQCPRARLLEGLCELVDADSAMLATVDDLGEGGFSPARDVEMVGLCRVGTSAMGSELTDPSVIRVVRRLGPSTLRCLFVHRHAGEPAFSAEERDLVTLFHAECSWLDAPRLNVTAVLRDTLSRRQMQTLELLMTRSTERQIADRLGVSVHTAHTYVKVIYRKLEVASRAELMARFLPAVLAATGTA